MVSGLMNVAPELAEAVAQGLGMTQMPHPMPRAIDKPVKPEVAVSGSLSLFARPGDGSIATRRVAILVADGVAADDLTALHARLLAGGAVPRFVATRLGTVKSVGGDPLDVGVSLEAAPSVVFDAMVLPDGAAAVERLGADGRTLEFLKDQYRHCKPILVLGASASLLEKAGIPPKLPDGKADRGLIVAAAGKGKAALDSFVSALAGHRTFERESDPPIV